MTRTGKAHPEGGNRVAVLQFDAAASILCPLTWDRTFLLNCIAGITFPAGHGGPVPRKQNGSERERPQWKVSNPFKIESMGLLGWATGFSLSNFQATPQGDKGFRFYFGAGRTNCDV